MVVHDSWHPMSWVVYTLVGATPGTSVKKAASVTWEAHTKGRAVVRSCHEELASSTRSGSGRRASCSARSQSSNGYADGRPNA